MSPSSDIKPEGALWFSASQISAKRDCEALWGFDKIASVPRGPSTDAQAFGHAVHEALRSWGMWADFGTDVVDVQQVAAATLARYPLRRDGKEYYEGERPDGGPLACHVNVEDRGEMFVVGLPMMDPRLSLIGFMDVMDLADMSDGVAHVIDYKTRSDKKYAPDEETLLDDVQGMVYAYALSRILPGINAVRFTQRNIIVKKKRDGTRAVREVYDTSVLHVRSVGFKMRWAEVTGTIIEMVGLKKQAEGHPDPLALVDGDYQKNRESCFNYGMCQYRKSGVCKQSRSDIVARAITKGKKDMGVLDKIKKQKTAEPKKKAPAKKAPKDKALDADLAAMRGLLSLNEKPPTPQKGETDAETLPRDVQPEPKAKAKAKAKAKPKAKAKTKALVAMMEDDEAPPPDGVTLYLDCSPSFGFVTVAELFDSLLMPGGTPWDLVDLDSHYIDRKTALRGEVLDHMTSGKQPLPSHLVVDTSSGAWFVLSDILLKHTRALVKAK